MSSLNNVPPFSKNIGDIKIQYMTNSTLVSSVKMEYGWKEYLPNLLETALLPRFFVYWARYFKFWLLAYFLILLNCAKFEEDWTTFILDILQGSHLWCFCFCNLPKIQRGDPCKMCNINVVQSSSNLAQFSKMKK